MIRSPLMTLPAEESPLIDLFRVVTTITGRTPGEVIRDVLYNLEPNAQAVAYISGTAGAAPGSKTGKVVIRMTPGTASPLTPLLANLNALSVVGDLTVGMTTQTEAQRGDNLAEQGVQVFRREGPDGKTMTFKAFGRVETEPTGGIPELAAVADARTASRRNIASIVDAILDAGDEGTAVVIDGDPERNPLGLVVALDSSYNDAGLSGVFAGTTGVDADEWPTFVEITQDAGGTNDAGETLDYEFGALPASSTNAANYQ